MDSMKKIQEYVENLTRNAISDTSVNLFDTGLLTSLDVLDLLDFVEQAFDIKIPLEEIDMDNFGSIDRMAMLVDRLTVAGA